MVATIPEVVTEKPVQGENTVSLLFILIMYINRSFLKYILHRPKHIFSIKIKKKTITYFFISVQVLSDMNRYASGVKINQVVPKITENVLGSEV